MAAGEVMAGPLSEFPAYVMQGKTEVNKNIRKEVGQSDGLPDKEAQFYA